MVISDINSLIEPGTKTRAGHNCSYVFRFMGFALSH
jgi:hypothetical protein